MRILFIAIFLIIGYIINVGSWTEESISGTSVGRTFTTQVTISSNLVTSSGNVGISSSTPIHRFVVSLGSACVSDGCLIMYDTAYSTQAYNITITNGALAITKR